MSTEDDAASKIGLPIQIATDSDSIELNTLSEVESWVDAQIEAYHWVKNPTQISAGNLTQLITDQIHHMQHQVGYLETASRAIKDHGLSPAQSTDATNHAGLYKAFRPLRKFNLPVADGAIERFFRPLVLAGEFEMNSVLVAQSLMRGVNPTALLTERVGLQGLTLFLQTRLGGVDFKESQSKLIAESIDESRELLEIMRSDYVEAEEKRTALLESLDTAANEYPKKINDIDDGYKKKIEEFRLLVEKQLATDSAVELWGTRSRRNLIFACVWGVLTAVCFGGLTYLFIRGDGIFEIAPLTTGGASQASTQVDWPRVARLIGFGAFAAWALRILIRLFMSALHHRTDAEFRRVCAHALLSLQARDAVTPDSNAMNLVLSALFAPTQTGFLKEVPGPETQRLVDHMITTGLKSPAKGN